MTFGGGKFLSYAAWIIKKKAQVLGRTHLSHFFAIVLGGLTIYREWHILVAYWSVIVSQDYRLIAAILFAVVVIVALFAWRYLGWELVILTVTSTSLALGVIFIFLGTIDMLILSITLITIFAAGWELIGNKLTTSPQEIRFVTAMRSLLPSLQKLTYGEDKEPDLEKRLDEFLEGFLEVTSRTLCGKTLVDAGFMREVPNQKKLELHKSSRAAKYPPELEIPVTDSGAQRQSATGPAGVAYSRLETVYMPFKDKKRAWPFQSLGESYEPSEPAEGWIPASSPLFERFCSVLCSPVAVYRKENEKRPFGVLNYSTKVRDPFVDRDFAMSECFSSILAQAMEAIRREALEQQRAAARADRS